MAMSSSRSASCSAAITLGLPFIYPLSSNFKAFNRREFAEHAEKASLRKKFTVLPTTLFILKCPLCELCGSSQRSLRLRAFLRLSFSLCLRGEKVFTLLPAPQTPPATRKSSSHRCSRAQAHWRVPDAASFQERSVPDCKCQQYYPAIHSDSTQQ